MESSLLFSISYPKLNYFGIKSEKPVLNSKTGALPENKLPENKLIDDKLKDDNKLKKACFELESLFLNQLMKEMRATIPKSEMMGGGKAEEIYTAMLDSQLTKEISLTKGIGLGEMIYKQMVKGKTEEKTKINLKS